MLKILPLLWALCIPYLAQASLCVQLFSKPIYSEPAINELANKALVLSEQLVENTSFPMRIFLKRQIKQTYREIQQRLSGPVSPVPLYLDPQFFGEFYWTSTVISQRSRAYIRTRVPFFNEQQRLETQIDITPWGVLKTSNQKYIKDDIFGIFVIGLDGNIYTEGVLERRTDRFRHSSFFAGSPVLFAGTIHLQPDGTITSLTRKSGHYKPSKERFEWAKIYLKALGFKISDEIMASDSLF